MFIKHQGKIMTRVKTQGNNHTARRDVLPENSHAIICVNSILQYLVLQMYIQNKAIVAAGNEESLGKVRISVRNAKSGI